MYVLYLMEANETGVIITTAAWLVVMKVPLPIGMGSQPMKLKIQFAVVEKALAGARIRKGTISAGYSLDVC